MNWNLKSIDDGTCHRTPITTMLILLLSSELSVHLWYLVITHCASWYSSDASGLAFLAYFLFIFLLEILYFMRGIKARHIKRTTQVKHIYIFKNQSLVSNNSIFDPNLWPINLHVLGNAEKYLWCTKYCWTGQKAWTLSHEKPKCKYKANVVH